MSQKLRATYDDVSDVLYISLGDPVPSEGDGVPNGVELDFAIDSGLPTGATVIGFRQYEWFQHLDQLSAILGKHLQLPASLIEHTLILATKSR